MITATIVCSSHYPWTKMVYICFELTHFCALTYDQIDHLAAAFFILVFASVVIFCIYELFSDFFTAIPERRRERRYRRYEQKVKTFSRRLADLKQLNERYRFYSWPEIKRTAEVNSKIQYDRFDYDSFFEEVVPFIISEIEKASSLAEKNQRLYGLYLQDLKKVQTCLGYGELRKLHLNPDLFHEIEESLTNEAILQPQREVIIICEKEYATPQGRYYYTERKCYSLQDVSKALRAKDERDRWKESKEYQRRAMSDSLRYDVLKRDGFRCTICGRTAADGVKLHVDHIRPVAKGGKTEKGNLRTLCEECNRGKRDKYDESGVN